MKIRVPATTANIGPGFDTMGIALNLYNYFELEEKKEKKTLADIAFGKYFEYIGKEIPNYSVKILDSEIPIARGLGSSASLIVGGIALANNLNNNYLSDIEILEIAIEVEGHPDNVTPAIFGGLCVSAVRDDKAFYCKREIDDSLNFVTFIPPYEVPTQKARSVLPKEIDYKKAIENMSNTAMIISLIGEKNYKDLSSFLHDNLHEPFRKELIKDYDSIKEISKNYGSIGTYISGSGPTMISLTLEEDFIEKLNDEKLSDIKILELKCDNEGYVVL